MNRPASTWTSAGTRGGPGPGQGRAAALLERVDLHRQLLWVDWQVERSRLLRMLVLILAGFAALQALTVTLVLLLGALTASGQARLLAPALLVLGLLAVVAWIWRGLRRLNRLGEQGFAASRREIAADLALWRTP